MLPLRYCLLIVIAAIVLGWPIIYLIRWFMFKRRVNKITKNMTSVDDYPLVGCALRFLGKDNAEISSILCDIIASHKTPFLGWLGPKCFVAVDHPDDIQVVVNGKGCMEKADIYRFFNHGAALFTAPAHIWKPQRKQLSLSFTKQICWSFLPIFNQKATLFAENIGQHIGKGDFDLMDYSTRCSLDIVLETVMGANLNIQNGENMSYMKAQNDWLSIVARRIANIFLHPDIIYKRTKMYRMETEAVARSDAVQEKLILQKMEEYDESNNNEMAEENENTEYKTPQIFIERLIRMRSKGEISDEAIRDQVHLVIFGGQDTSSYTIAMTLLLLAMHPHIEQRVMDEIESVFGDSPIDADVTMDQVTQLTYLEQTMKEVLRLFPVGPFLFRHCTEDTQLSNCVIPKGTEVAISVQTAHRRKDIWGEDADEFNPEHFSAEASAQRSSYAFMAFSGGPRNCMGQRFAYISLKVILSKVLRRYKITTRTRMDQLKFRLEVTNKPVNGVIVQVENRA